MKTSERVVVEPKVMKDKPVIKGTWFSVEYVLGLFVAGWSYQQILARHAELTTEDVRACLAFAREKIDAAGC